MRRNSLAREVEYLREKHDNLMMITIGSTFLNAVFALLWMLNALQ